MSAATATKAGVMDVRSLVPGWTFPAMEIASHIRKYSTTGDILSYKRCKRQYGYFGVRGFSSAVATQRYFGTLVHDVLDRIHREYKLAKSTKGGTPALPDEARVRELVKDAHDRLIRSGVRPFNGAQQQEVAAKRIYRFVRLVGPAFFPNVKETEYRLERVLTTHVGRDYVLDGVVDILSGAVAHELVLPFSTAATDVEIWDYKSGKAPDKQSGEMIDYEFQMRVYAQLYKEQTGEYPARCVLAFLGELSIDRHWNEQKPDVLAFPKLVYTVHPDQKMIDTAMRDFHETVEAIEAERAKPYGQQWEAPSHEVGDETCDACDLRFSCTNYKDAARQRVLPL